MPTRAACCTCRSRVEVIRYGPIDGSDGVGDAVHTLGVALARTFPLKNTAECCAALQSCSLAAAHSHTPLPSARSGQRVCGCAEHVISCSALACTRFTHLQVRIGPRSSGSVVSYIGVYRPGENVVLSTASSIRVETVGTPGREAHRLPSWTGALPACCQRAVCRYPFDCNCR